MGNVQFGECYECVDTEFVVPTRAVCEEDDEEYDRSQFGFDVHGVMSADKYLLKGIGNDTDIDIGEFMKQLMSRVDGLEKVVNKCSWE